MVSEEVGISLDAVTLEMLGSAKRIEITKDETTIVDGIGESPRSRPAVCRSALRPRKPPDYDREKLERLAKLAAALPSSASAAPRRLR